MVECQSRPNRFLSKEQLPHIDNLYNESDDFEIINEEDIISLKLLEDQEKLNLNVLDHLRFEHNKKVLSQLNPGDLIEFKRKLYSHWALYIGNSKLIHFHGNIGNRASHLNISGVQLPYVKNAQVMISNYWDVIEDSYAFRNNLFDKLMKPLPLEEILGRAYEKVGHHDFNIVSNNCEHFVKYCRYGISSSDQMTFLIRFGNVVTKNLRIFKYNCKKMINA